MMPFFYQNDDDDDDDDGNGDDGDGERKLLALALVVKWLTIRVFDLAYKGIIIIWKIM